MIVKLNLMKILILKFTTNTVEFNMELAAFAHEIIICILQVTQE